MAHEVPQDFGPWVRADGGVLNWKRGSGSDPEEHCGGHGNITSTGGLYKDKSTP